MENYEPTPEDLKRQSKMMKLGFKVYPIVADEQKGKRWPLVVIAFEYKLKERISESPPFPQSLLSYEYFRLYETLYNKIIK